MHRSRVLRGFWWSVFAGICFANCNPRFDLKLTRVPRLGDRGRSAIGLHGALGSRLGCAWPRLGCAWPRLGFAWSMIGCAWSRLGCAWSMIGCAWSTLGCAWSMLVCARSECSDSRGLDAVAISMHCCQRSISHRQNGHSPKIVLDSNLTAPENASNGNTFVIHCRPIRQRCISHLRRSPNKSMHRSRVLRGFWWSVFAGICFANCNPRFDRNLTRVPRLGDRGRYPA